VGAFGGDGRTLSVPYMQSDKESSTREKLLQFRKQYRGPKKANGLTHSAGGNSVPLSIKCNPDATLAGRNRTNQYRKKQEKLRMKERKKVPVYPSGFDTSLFGTEGKDRQQENHMLKRTKFPGVGPEVRDVNAGRRGVTRERR